MRTIFLLSCCKEKTPYAAQAKDLYISENFKMEMKLANLSKADDIFILSAKYGLVKQDMILEPYDKTLLTMTTEENKTWSEKVISDLQKSCNLKSDKFIILAVDDYFKNLIPSLTFFEIPFKGLSSTERHNWLSAEIARLKSNH